MSYKFYISEPRINTEQGGFTYEVISYNQVKITIPGNYYNEIPDKIAIGSKVYGVVGKSVTDIGDELTNDPTFTTGGTWYTNTGATQSWNDGTAEVSNFTDLYSGEVLTIGNLYYVKIDVQSKFDLDFIGGNPTPTILLGSNEFIAEATDNRFGLDAYNGSSVVTMFSIKEKTPQYTIITLDTTDLLVGQESTFYFVDEWTEVVEPIGWDGFEYNLIRSKQYTGLENIYSEVDLTWEYPHSEPFINQYEINHFDGSHRLKIVDECDGTELIGELNYLLYTQNGKDISLRLEDSGFDRTFKNRLDIPVNLDSGAGVDGNIINNQPEVIKLHQKDYIELSDFIKSGNEISTTSDTGFDQFSYPPITQNAQEIRGEYNPGGFFVKWNTSEAYYNFRPERSGAYKFKIKLKGRFITSDPDFDPVVTAPGIRVSTNLIYGADITPVGSPGNIELFSAAGVFNTGVSFDIDQENEITLNAGDYVVLRNFNDGIFDLTDGISVYSFFRFEYEIASIEIEALLDFPPTTVRGYDLFDAFKIASEAITGESDCFRSDLLETGCAREILLTNGYNIRRLFTKTGQNYPIYASFNDLYNALNAHFAIGIKLEYEGDKRIIRLEDVDYFYTQEPVVTFENAESVKRTPAIDRLYNEIEIGPVEYQDETLNGLDEFNAMQVYSLPVRNAKKRLIASTRYITAGFVIEAGRRIQYQTDPSRDWNFDSKNFLICKNRVPVTSAKYGDGLTTYPPGYISERNELFNVVNNLFSPETAYNLRLSPKRSLLNWYPVLANASNVLKFQSGLGNINLETEESSECNTFFSKLVENSNLDGTNQRYKTRLFGESYLDFEYPVTLSEFKNIVTNSNKMFAVTYCDIKYTGFIEEVKFRPEDQGGPIASIRLIELSSCDASGSFDEGFDEGFEIDGCGITTTSEFSNAFGADFG